MEKKSKKKVSKKTAKNTVISFDLSKEGTPSKKERSSFDIPMFNYKLNSSFITHIKSIPEIPNIDINKLNDLIFDSDKKVKTSGGLTIQCQKIVDIIGIYEKEFLEKLFTHLYPYQTFFKTKEELCEYDLLKTTDGKLNEESYSPYDGKNADRNTVPDFNSKSVNALFFDPDTAIYKYYRLCIKPSSIKKAGMGVYAEENIPGGLYGFYKGNYTTLPNELYTWTIFKFDMINGETLDSKITSKWSLDAYDINTSNWTRFVNCGILNRKNNVFAVQKFHMILYKTDRHIKKSDELFVDYGADYRTEHLKIDDKKY